MQRTNIYSQIESPIGKLLLIADGEFLTGLRFHKPSSGFGTLAKGYDVQEKASVVLQEAANQLLQYFRGQLTVFDIPMKFHGSDFQRSVWNELFTIPYGETVSYLDIAKRIGDPTAARAVGWSNGQNPLPIIYPCHRVIGSNGKLTGYGGGIGKKEWLLRHEGAWPLRSPQTSLF